MTMLSPAAQRGIIMEISRALRRCACADIIRLFPPEGERTRLEQLLVQAAQRYLEDTA